MADDDNNENENNSKRKDKLKRKKYDKELARLHVELVKVQEWVKH